MVSSTTTRSPSAWKPWKVTETSLTKKRGKSTARNRTIASRPTRCDGPPSATAVAFPAGASHSASSVKTAVIRPASWVANSRQACWTMSRLMPENPRGGKGFRAGRFATSSHRPAQGVEVLGQPGPEEPGPVRVVVLARRHLDQHDQVEIDPVQPEPRPRRHAELRRTARLAVAVQQFAVR